MSKSVWIRAGLSFILIISGTILILTVPWTAWAKVGFVGLSIVAIASWWVGWPDEEA